METQKKKNNFESKLIDGPVELKGSKGVVMLVSRQELTNGDSVSEHIVISKIRRSVDGVQNGPAKVLWVPVELAKGLTESILSLKKK